MRRTTDKAWQGIILVLVAMVFAGLATAYLLVRGFSKQIGHPPLIPLWLALAVLAFASYGIVMAVLNLYRYFDGDPDTPE